MAANDFLPVANAGGANVVNQATYAAAPQVPVGWADGEVPDANLWNKMMRQSASIIAMVAAFIAAPTPAVPGIAMLDDGNQAAKLAIMNQAFRIRLQAATTFHISATGNDGTGNGSAGAPWATFAHAISAVQSTYDTNGFAATFKWDTVGACTEGVSVNGLQVGVTDPSQYIFDFGGQALTQNAVANFVGRYGCLCTIQNAVISNTSINSGIVASDNGIITLGVGLVFGSQVGSHIVAQLGGRIGQSANYTITGGGVAHLNINSAGRINMLAGTTVTLTGTPAFSTAFVSCNSSGYIGSSGVTFTGAATGVRYTASLNGVIATTGSGANYFPGNSAGTTATGGQYA